MVSEELLNYIEKELKKGFGKKEIQNALFAVGYKKIDVKNAFSRLTQPRVQKKLGDGNKGRQMPKYVEKIVIVAIIVALLVVGVHFLVKYIKTEGVFKLAPGEGGVGRKEGGLTETDLQIIENGVNACKNNEEYVQCIAKFATRPSRCESEISGCIDGVYKEAFMYTKNGMLCDQMKIKKNKDICFLEMATKTKDASFCDKIKGRSIGASCRQELQ